MPTSRTYEYVIVGAGSAGCVLAHRLSADEATSFLLLEAGEPDDKPAIHVPNRWRELPDSDLDWGYTTVPQPGVNGREIPWPLGKTLGGSSSINAMMYVRGHPWDYDRWERLENDGWSYEQLLPYFRRAEDFEDGASEFHGEGGPLTITRQDSAVGASDSGIERPVTVARPPMGEFSGSDSNSAMPLSGPRHRSTHR